MIDKFYRYKNSSENALKEDLRILKEKVDSGVATSIDADAILQIISELDHIAAARQACERFPRPGEPFAQPRWTLETPPIGSKPA